MKNLFLFIMFAAVVVYLGFHFMPKKVPVPADPKAMLLSVTVTSPQMKSINETMSLTGNTIPREEINITTELANVKITDVLVDVGSVVEKGQKLATLDKANLENQLADLQSAYDRALDEYKRIEAIKDTGAVSKESVIQKKTALQAAEAKLKDAQLSLERSNVIATEAGVVYERMANIGAVVNNNQVLFRLARAGDIEVDITAPEADLNKFKVGQVATITLSGEDKARSGTVRLITPMIDAASRMGHIRITLNEDVGIAVGAFASAEIVTEEYKGLTLPVTAIQEDRQGSYVWQLTSNNKAERLDITIVRRQEDSVFVKSIPENIRVIARAGSFIKQGEAVNVVEAP